MAAVQDRAHAGNGLTGEPRLGACSGRKRPRALPGDQAGEKEAIPKMTSVAIRDPLADHLITPQNAAFMVIDYQHNQFNR